MFDYSNLQTGHQHIYYNIYLHSWHMAIVSPIPIDWLLFRPRSPHIPDADLIYALRINMNCYVAQNWVIANFFTKIL